MNCDNAFATFQHAPDGAKRAFQRANSVMGAGSAIVAGPSPAGVSSTLTADELRAAIAEAEKANSATAKTPTAAAAPPNDPVQTFNSLLAHLMKEGRTQAEATREIFRTDPGLQANYVSALQQQQQRASDYKELDAMRGREARGYQPNS